MRNLKKKGGGHLSKCLCCCDSLSSSDPIRARHRNVFCQLQWLTCPDLFLVIGWISHISNDIPQTYADAYAVKMSQVQSSLAHVGKSRVRQDMPVLWLSQLMSRGCRCSVRHSTGRLNAMPNRQGQKGALPSYCQRNRGAFP